MFLLPLSMELQANLLVMSILPQLTHLSIPLDLWLHMPQHLSQHMLHPHQSLHMLLPHQSLHMLHPHQILHMLLPLLNHLMLLLHLNHPMLHPHQSHHMLLLNHLTHLPHLSHLSTLDPLHLSLAMIILFLTTLSSILLDPMDLRLKLLL